jgi:hypothetical protein
MHGNAAMRTDPVLKDVTLSDIAGGSAVFYDSKVKLVKVQGVHRVRSDLPGI